MTAEISSIFKRVLPLCPSCRAEISEDDSFCQECGSALSLVDADHLIPRLGRLTMARLHPSLGKPVVTLPLVALAVVGLALITFFLLGFEKSYSGFSNHYVIEQATQAYKETRFDEAATMLERLSISHKLDDEQRSLLSDVYLARSEQRVGRSDYAGAMSDLDKIPPQYWKFVLVTGKRNELVELIKVQQAQAQAQAASATKTRLKSERSKLRLAAKTLVPSSNNSVSQAPQTISVAVPTETIPTVTASPVQINRPETPDSRQSQSARLDIPSAGNQFQATHFEVPASHFESPARIEFQGSRSESQAPRYESPWPRAESQPTASGSPASRSEPSAQKGLLKAKAAKITENDQVRYNELLAGYFSQEHKQSSGSTEPPSLKEWIDIGRPKF